MKSTVAAIFSLLVVVLLQSYFFGAMRPLGVLPNLLLVMLTYLAMLRPASQSLAVAILGGLLLDLISGTDFGLRMAFYSLFTLGVVMARQLGASLESFWSVVGLIAAGTVIYNLAVLGSLIIVRTEFSPLIAARLVAIELAFNLVFAALFGRAWRWLLKSAPEGLGA